MYLLEDGELHVGKSCGAEKHVFCMIFYGNKMEVSGVGHGSASVPNELGAIPEIS